MFHESAINLNQTCHVSTVNNIDIDALRLLQSNFSIRSETQPIHEVAHSKNISMDPEKKYTVSSQLYSLPMIYLSNPSAKHELTRYVHPSYRSSINIKPSG